MRSSVPSQLHRSKYPWMVERGGKSVRNGPPLATCRQNIHEAVHHLAHDHRALVAAALGGRDQQLKQAPIRHQSDRWDSASSYDHNERGCSDVVHMGGFVQIRPPPLRITNKPSDSRTSRTDTEVIVCASSADKLARLKDLGADHGIDYSKEDFVKWIYSKFGKPHRRSFEGGVDVVVNFTGGDTWVPSLKTLHRQGRILTCGATAGFDPKEDLRFIWTYELNIRGSNGWMREDLTALLNLLGSGKLKPIIDRELSLADTNEAFRLLEDRLVFGKVIVKP